MNANDRQVGGSHYNAPIQHWDYVLANDIPYLEAQVIKYLTRWRKKNGFQDILKAKHFLDKLIEVEGMKPKPDPTNDLSEILDQWPFGKSWQTPQPVQDFKGHDIAIDPSKPWPPRLYCSCNVKLPCPMHGDGSEPGPGYVNQG